MIPFEKVLDRVISSAQSNAEALLRLWEDGSLTDDEFVQALAYLVDNSRAKGAHGSITVLRDYLAQEGSAVLDVALPESRVAGIPTAVETILASDQDTRMQVLRLVAGEVMSAAHDSYGETLRREPSVKGWVRGLESGACELCQWLYRDGHVYPQDAPMHTHTGCKCHQIPVFRK